ncbi:MAG: capsular biosynthesis protein [Bacteroidetes bacterium]|nr:capsular biosynthesis protein [Bacteroidota bacterium]
MSILSKLFGRHATEVLQELSVLQVDVHSHFIPGIDDGAKTLEDSLTLIKAMSDFGYRKVITTPHVMSDFFRNSPETILGGLDPVRAALNEQGYSIEIDAAAEYYYDYELESKIGKEPLLTFGERYLLFEVSYVNAPDNLDQLIFNLQSNGYQPVLAHPERYPFWFRDFSVFEKLKDKGVLFQLNINSLTGHYSPATKKVAEQMIDKNYYEFLGSDCHHYGHIELMKKVRQEKYLGKLLSSGILRNQLL